jgi:DNA-binding GntR family transcriptional regulator
MYTRRLKLSIATHPRAWAGREHAEQARETRDDIVTPPTGTAHTSAESVSPGVGRCLQQIRQMILDGELLPGQKVHQAELAAQLELSRIPVREALSTLQAEGVLVYRANSGFSVARFNAEDLAEIYLLRRLIETELLRSIDLDGVNAEELEEINRRLAAVSPSEHSDEYQQINMEFHFTLFDRSPLEFLKREVERLWYKSTFYRALYLYEVDAQLHVIEDHERIIAAVRAGDVEELITASDDHRGTTTTVMTRRLGKRSTR